MYGDQRENVECANRKNSIVLPSGNYVFSGEHENSPPLGGIWSAAVNKTTLQAKQKTKQNNRKQNKKKKKKQNNQNSQSSILFDNRNILSLLDSCKYHLSALWIAKLSL